ncbi:MAG: SDR family NAD(P)-dependent oxidoreductase [Chitinophagales bacterium]|nr:SDR family NAD(P)-dependent oxidoreductase [Chitinophagales bacterium]
MDKKYALVTGGSSGIGLEIAMLLAQRGYALLLVSNEEKKLHQLAATLAKQFNVPVKTLCINLAQTHAAEQVYEFAANEGIEVEILVNSAGFFFFGQAVDADIEKAKAKIQLHVLTLSMLCTLFGKDMRQRKRGFILNISSISAFKDFPGIAYYGASKSYIKSFTRSLHTEMKLYNVHVTALCPGATATNLYDPNVIDVELGKKLGVMMPPHKVAKAGVEALFKNKPEVVPGVVTKLMLYAALLTPQWVIYQIRKHTKWLN